MTTTTQNARLTPDQEQHLIFVYNAILDDDKHRKAILTASISSQALLEQISESGTPVWAQEVGQGLEAINLLLHVPFYKK